MKKTGPCIPLLLSLILLFSFSEGTAANAQNATGRNNVRPEKQSNVFTAFDSWAGDFQSAASADVRSGLMSEGLVLAQQRRAVLAELVKSDPARALALAVPASVREKLPLQIADELETPISGIGDFSVLGAIQRKDGPRVQPIQRRVRINGQTYPAYVFGKRLSQTNKRGIPIRGILVNGAVALDDISVASGDAPVGDPPSAWTIGLKNVLVIRVDFSDLQGDPVGWNDTSPLSNNNTVYTEAYVQNIADSRISPFYQQSSYGQTTLSNTVSPLVYRMPQTAAAYVTSPDGVDQIHEDAQAAASADFNMADFDRIIVLFSFLGNLPNSSFTFGGLGQLLDKQIWLNGEFDFRVVTHELGHTFGLLHAGLWEVDDGDPISPNGIVSEYGDDFDTMGANFANDARTDFNPYFKNMMGWLPDSKVQLASTNGTYRIYAFDSANYLEATNNPILAVKFVKDAERTYWIGTRRNFANNPSMHNGAYVMWGFESVGAGGGGGFQSSLLDLTTPGTNAAPNLPNDYDAALDIKANFQDPAISLSITPLAGDNSVINGYLDVQFGQGSALSVFTNLINGGNGNGIIDFNECNNLFVILTNAGVAVSNVAVTITTTTPKVIIAQGFSPYPNIPNEGSAANLVPFKISTAPDFVCGTSVDLTLVIRTDSETRTNFVRLPSGTSDLPIRFNNNTVVAIPDGDPVGVSSPIVVSNFNSVVGNVSVALHVTHPINFDLQMELIAPDGTSVMLSQNNGGGGPNYGFSCSPDNFRTRFDDSAIVPISAANAPFVGVFKPEQPLATFNLKSGTNVNGTWQLKVVDQIPFLTGTIQCWSLFLSPQICTDGGGECPGSDLEISMIARPDPVVNGSNLTYTITVTNFGPSTAKAVVLSHALPTGAIFVSANTSQGTSQHSGGVVTCNLGIISAGGSATATVVVNPTIDGTVSSTATVASNQTDPDTSNNSVTVFTRVVPPSADLAVTVSDSPDPISAGGNLTYTITVTNRGPTSATGVFLTNTLPSTAVFVSASSTQGSFVNAGGTIIYNLGSISNTGGAVVTIVVRPTVVGTITETSRVISSLADLFPANNVASATTTVSPAADLALAIVDSPDPVVTGSNLTYVITLTNHGPNAATAVIINGTLPSSAVFVTNTISQGSFARNGDTFTVNLTSLASGDSSVITIAMAAPNTPQILNLAATAFASQSDPNSTNNTATATTTVARPFVSITQAGATLTAESIEINGSVDPGETVSVILRLRNAGNISTTNLVATLLSTGGVTSLSVPQNYGQLAAGGASVGNTFSFTANGNIGETITATLQLHDNAGPFTNVTFAFTLPTVATFANTNLITIPDNGIADPYPSQITVSNVTGIVGKVTVTLDKINHTYPDDIDVLLVDPTGRKVLLMADAGGGNQLSGVSLTLDSTAATALADEDQLVFGNFNPANYSPDDSFTNAPAGPYETSLSALDGTAPNGTWSLFVVDDTAGDQGNIAGGWSLAITTLSPVNQLADLSVVATNFATAMLVNANASYTFIISNSGPDTAHDVILNNPLPPNCTAITPTTFHLGSLAVGGSTNVTVIYIAGALGMMTNIATVSVNEVDLNLVNNTALSVTAVSFPAADLAILVSTPAGPIAGFDFTYTISVTNNGPDTAYNVVVTNQLPATTSFVSANASQGTCSNSAGVVQCVLGHLGANTSATISIVATPLAAGLITNNAYTISASSDLPLANNFSTLITTVIDPSPNIVASGASLVSESAPANGVIDSGEEVQVAFVLANIGSANTANLVATLQASGGVNSSSSQNYGVLVYEGAAVSRTFTFTATGTNGGIVTATLQLQDGANDLGTVSFAFDLPKLNSFANNTTIFIPNSGPATPYPSAITITNATGLVSKVAVTLNGLKHSFPDDLDILLIGPGGQKVMLMSDVGGAHSISNVTLTFNDEGSSLSNSNKVFSGTNSPTDFDSGESLPPSAPSGPYASFFTVFNGSNPNGVWSLYINDDTGGDSGNISGGWSLALTTVNTINPAANLAVSVSAPATTVAGELMSYTIIVSNRGPAFASGVTLSDVLPANFTFNSAFPSQGSYFDSGGIVTCNLGNLSPNTAAIIILSGTPTATGIITNSATVTANETDLYLINNTAHSTTAVSAATPSSTLGSAAMMPNGNFQLILNGQAGTTYRIDASSNLTTWTPVETNEAGIDGTFQFNDTVATNYNPRFYRAVQLPSVQ